MNGLALRTLYARLLEHMGPSGWWPADSRFEIMVGAVLTQNTAWGNVASSLNALRQAGALDPRAIAAMGDARLQALIRPSGFYVNKARSLKALCQWCLSRCDVDLSRARDIPDAALRAELLGIFGIGGETADDLMLYVFDRRAFIADTYARRLLTFLGVDAPRGYEALCALAMSWVLADGFTVTELKELHGLIDEFGKRYRTPEAMGASFLAHVRGGAYAEGVEELPAGSPNQPR